MNLISLTLALQQGPAGNTTQPDPAGLAAIIMVFLIFVGVLILVQIAINIIVCLLIINGYKQVPPEHQKIGPNMVWLLMIPLFNVVWNFIVFQRIPESYQSAFAARGQTNVGDCGKQLGMWFSICVACSIVPCVNYIAAPAALVLLIIFLVKLYDLKSKLLAPAPVTTPQGPTPPTAT